MVIPTVVAVARLSNSSRRLFRTARSLAIELGSAELQGLHLFLAASRMDKTKVNRFVPARPRARLSEERGINALPENRKQHLFLPVSQAISNVCRTVAKSEISVLPEALLSNVFKLDLRTRTSLKELLGDQLFGELRDRLVLNEFMKDERTELVRLRNRFLMEKDYDNNRDKNTSEGI